MEERNGEVLTRSLRGDSNISRVCGSLPTPITPIDMMEFSTTGARSPIRFSRANSHSSGWSYTGGRHQEEVFDHELSPFKVTASFSSPETHQSHARRAINKAKTRSWYRRISTPPLDGVCLTLLGVSVGLKSPGVDPWAVARALVDCSVDLRTRNSRGMTPLHMACAAGQVSNGVKCWVF